jgi:hypothetical protein
MYVVGIAYPVVALRVLLVDILIIVSITYWLNLLWLFAFLVKCLYLNLGYGAIISVVGRLVTLIINITNIIQNLMFMYVGLSKLKVIFGGEKHLSASLRLSACPHISARHPLVRRP